MTLRFMEGFEANQTSAALVLKYPGATIDAGASFVTGRLHGIALSSGDGLTTFTKVMPAAHDELVVGMALYVDNPYSVANIELIAFYNGATKVHTLELQASGDDYQFVGKTGAGATIFTSAATYTAGAYRYIEYKVDFETGATGSYDLVVNEVSADSGSGVVTGTTNTTCDTVEINIRRDPGGDVRLDDIYGLDTAGGQRADFLGDFVIEAITVDAEGNQNDWTPSAGADNSDLVDDPLVNDGDTTYVSTEDNSDIDLYTYTDLAFIAANILGIEVQIDARIVTSGARNLQVVHRHTDTVETNSASVSVDDTAYKFYSAIFEQEPGGAADWTLGDLNGAEFGFESVA